MPYSARFKQKMIEKLTGPEAISATALSKEVDVSQVTLSRWLRDATLGVMKEPKKASKSRRRSRSASEKIRLVREAAGLGESALGAFLRREGLHKVELDRLTEEVDEAAMESLSKQKRRRQGPSPEEKENRRLRKELARKEKALAEAAALLVLRGKVQAFLLAEEEGDTDESSVK